MTQSQEEDDDDFSQNSFYFSEQSESESSISEGSKSASDSGDDREFTGDMFMKKKPIKFAAGQFDKQGQQNLKLGTNDFCVISIWSTGGMLMRFTRLKSSIIKIPPLENDAHFRLSHNAQQLYYIGKEYG